MMKMKKILLYSMMAATAAAITCCSEEDPFEELASNNGNESWTDGGNMMTGGNGNSATTGELATFDIVIDKTSAEPSTTASGYYPNEEDILENNEFTTEVSIDMSNPVNKTENGVEVMGGRRKSPRAKMVRLVSWALSVAAVFAIVFGLSFYFKERVDKRRPYRTATVKQKGSILNNLKAKARAEAEAQIAESVHFDGNALDSAEYEAMVQQMRKELAQMADTTCETFMAEYQKAVAEFEASLNATAPLKEKEK